ncbi:hypothetical protein NP233_g581 [Leucocoprinus birnbaumii]|uniref:PUB domain-containing protein n=1 Tax=Leucocoprinus birnbaumii TaxID=56174 RepID=A0AAD5W5B0_9AGAR|nr:hypothetical protein NP233_g581 [Leucocoprinus birnbaumii]
MSSSPSRSPEARSVSSNATAAAALARAQQSPAQKSAAQLAAEHDRRQTFRRLIDPGITLLTIADNLIRDPENPKFKQFKSTNTVIQRELMNPKGAIEYAIEMGFRPEVKDFQPYYTFNPRYMDDLQIGARILRDFIDLETEKIERAAKARANEKANAAAAAERVRLAFMDDRRTKELKDEMERQQRIARAAAPPGPTSPRASLSTAPPSTLGGAVVIDDAEEDQAQSEKPPPYDQ